MRAVPVEAGLFELLQLAARDHGETDGAFDITAGPLIKAWGFFRGRAACPSDDELAAALERVGMRHVVLDPKRRTVRFLRPRLEINLGSIGKGYALDRAAAMLRDGWGICPAPVARRAQQRVRYRDDRRRRPRGWPVGLEHPWDPDRRLAVVRLRDRALATRRRLTSTSTTMAASSATSSTRAPAGRPRASPAPRASPRPPPRPTPWPPRSSSSASSGRRRYCADHPEVGAVLLPGRAGRRAGRDRLAAGRLAPADDDHGWQRSLGLGMTRINGLTCFFLIVLRLAIGWHFLVEGDRQGPVARTVGNDGYATVALVREAVFLCDRPSARPRRDSASCSATLDRRRPLDRRQARATASSPAGPGRPSGSDYFDRFADHYELRRRADGKAATTSSTEHKRQGRRRG